VHDQQPHQQRASGQQAAAWQPQPQPPPTSHTSPPAPAAAPEQLSSGSASVRRSHMATTPPLAPAASSHPSRSENPQGMRAPPGARHSTRPQACPSPAAAACCRRAASNATQHSPALACCAQVGARGVHVQAVDLPPCPGCAAAHAPPQGRRPQHWFGPLPHVPHLQAVHQAALQRHGRCQQAQRRGERARVREWWAGGARAHQGVRRTLVRYVIRSSLAGSRTRPPGPPSHLCPAPRRLTVMNTWLSAHLPCE
jgi:hypothetical protein